MIKCQMLLRGHLRYELKSASCLCQLGGPWCPLPGVPAVEERGREENLGNFRSSLCRGEEVSKSLKGYNSDKVIFFPFWGLGNL